jgi:type III secretion system YscD/HrpQ family protein
MNHQQKSVHVLVGLHSGAQVEIDDGSALTVGSDPSCDIVLSDAGVAPKHMLLSVDQYGASCRALAAPIKLADRTLLPGQLSAIDDFRPIRCGDAVLGVSDTDAPAAGWDQWHAAQRIPPAEIPASRNLNVLRRVNPYALFVSVIVGIAGVIGLAYATFTRGDEGSRPGVMSAAQEWLRGIAPPRSELQIARENSGQLVLSGYVARSAQRDELFETVAHSTYNPRVEVYAADQMQSSLLRLAQLQGLSCIPQYMDSGRVACTNSVPNEIVATKLKLLAKEVPGITALDTRLSSQAVEPVTGTPAVSQASGQLLQTAVTYSDAPRIEPPTSAKITNKFSVFMFRDKRYLVDTSGRRYTEGEEFDGFTIGRIGVDEVTFNRDGREYEFQVGTFGAGR